MSADEQWPIPVVSDADFSRLAEDQRKGRYAPQRGDGSHDGSIESTLAATQQHWRPTSPKRSRTQRSGYPVPPRTTETTAAVSGVRSPVSPATRRSYDGSANIRQSSFERRADTAWNARSRRHAAESARAEDRTDQLRRHPTRTYWYIHEHIHEHRHTHRYRPNQADEANKPNGSTRCRARDRPPGGLSTSRAEHAPSRPHGDEYEYFNQRPDEYAATESFLPTGSHTAASNARTIRRNAASAHTQATPAATTTQRAGYGSLAPVEYDWYAHNPQYGSRHRWPQSQPQGRSETSFR